jgi:anti-sigma B factor antagonist
VIKGRTVVDYFNVALTVGHDRARLQLQGELDAAAAGELAALFDEACAGEPSLLLVDLSELSFCDSSGIHVLLVAAARCAESQIDMRIVGTRPNVRRVLELMGSAEVLRLAQD